jgi:hypothetical protein
MHATLSDTFFNVVNVIQHLQHSLQQYTGIPVPVHQNHTGTSKPYRYRYFKTIQFTAFCSAFLGSSLFPCQEQKQTRLC